jgi:hypothetical protein
MALSRINKPEDISRTTRVLYLDVCSLDRFFNRPGVQSSVAPRPKAWNWKMLITSSQEAESLGVFGKLEVIPFSLADVCSLDRFFNRPGVQSSVVARENGMTSSFPNTPSYMVLTEPRSQWSFSSSPRPKAWNWKMLITSSQARPLVSGKKKKTIGILVQSVPYNIKTRFGIGVIPLLKRRNHWGCLGN